MATPFVQSGFGSFSRILGPWTDFFPSSGGAGLESSQFGVALGTKIQGGARGATITKILADPPYNSNTSTLNWRLLVIRGEFNPLKLKVLDNKYQLATLGWPRFGGGDLDEQILFEKVIIGNHSSAQNDTLYWDLGDDGPSVGPGETMTVLFFPLFNANGVPGYGAGNLTYVNLNIFGKMEQVVGTPGDRDNRGRSIPRGRIGGI